MPLLFLVVFGCNVARGASCAGCDAAEVGVLLFSSAIVVIL